MRSITCSLHGKKFRGKGMTRVLHKIVFHFCSICWADREACEGFMRRVVASGSDSGKKRAALEAI